MDRKIFIVPIEPLEERYSAQWLKWWPEAFTDYGIDFELIMGEELTSKIETGSFLDVCGTNYFKATQTAKICKMIYNKEITNNDILLYLDLWNPGLCHVQYIRQGMNLDFKICGVLHAGTYDPYDFLSKQGMVSWGHLLENCWFNFVDQIYVATEFHKKLIVSKRRIDPDKIKITGLPIYSDQDPDMSLKENIVVFPHRLDEEKNPNLFDWLADQFKYSGWQFIKTKEVCKTKKEYFEILNKAKIAVSFADQETWGIAQQEALFAKCFPVVPNKLSYKELYHRVFRFSELYESVQCIKKFMKPTKRHISKMLHNREALLQQGDVAILNMVVEMEKL